MGTMKQEAKALLFLAFGILYSSASFVHHISPNEFEIDLEEQGVKLTQKVRFENGLTITEVPDHHDISAATYVYDQSKGLMLDVVPRTSSCYIHRPTFAMDFKMEQRILEEPSFQENEEKEFFKVTPEMTRDVELMTITGPELESEDLPPNLANYCPPEFRIFLSKQVEVNSTNVQRVSKDRTLLDDPLFKREVMNGDIVPDFSEVFQFLPPSAKKNYRRHKRGTCYSAAMELRMEDCYYTEVTCPGGCPLAEAQYDCTNKVWNCEYVLVCSPSKMNKECLWHIRDGKVSCSPCCKIRNCGNGFRQCPLNTRP